MPRKAHVPSEQIALTTGGWFDPSTSSLLHEWDWWDGLREFKELRLYRTAKNTLVVRYPFQWLDTSLGTAVFIQWQYQAVDSFAACGFMMSSSTTRWGAKSPSKTIDVAKRLFPAEADQVVQQMKNTEM